MKTHHLLALLLFLPAFNPAGAQTVIDVSNPITGNIIAISQSGDYTLTGATSQNRVVVAAGVKANITLSNVSITSATASPFELVSTSNSGANVALLLTGNNTLASTVENSNIIGTRYSAAIQVEDASTLSIDGPGTLTANGSAGAAGIGSGFIEGGTGHTTGHIIINGGHITARGGYLGAGIGGSPDAQGGSIVVNGGTLTLTGGEGAAALGGGYHHTGGNIAINGGTLTARGGYQGAGIGAGTESPAGSITITAGTLTVAGGATAAGIGGGMGGAGGSITLAGGDITVTGGDNSAGIGGGSHGASGNIVITGGNIIAGSLNGGAAAIGTGANADSNSGSASANAITINGGNVTATASEYAAAIGNGFGSVKTDINIGGGTVLAIGYRDISDAAAIGGCSGGDPGNIRITGGTIYACGYTGAGIGGGVGSTGGSINIAGGIVIVDNIGTGNNVATPTTVTGGLIIAGSINATSFGSAHVTTGATLTEDFLRAMAATPMGSIVSDTLYFTDTIVEVRLVHDTATHENYVVIDPTSGAEQPVEGNAAVTLIPAGTDGFGSDLYYISGLEAGKDFSVYAGSGVLIYRGNRQPVRIVGSGVFVVGQGGEYWKVVK